MCERLNCITTGELFWAGQSLCGIERETFLSEAAHINTEMVQEGERYKREMAGPQDDPVCFAAFFPV